MKATKLPSGSWRALVYMGKGENGKRIYESVTRNSEYDCLQEATRLAKHHHEITMNPSAMNLGEAIDRYISMKSNVLSPATIRGYDNIRRNHLQPEMGIQIRKIDNTTAQIAINRESKTCGPKTVANIFGLLKTVAHEFAGKELSVTLPQKVDKDIHILTKDECQKLVKVIEGDSAEVPILLAMCLGLRRSEIMALEHSDWDSENRILSITKAAVPNKTGQFIVKTTKTRKSQRKLPVSDFLAKKLDQCVTDNIRFCPIHITAVCKHLTKACKKAGIEHIGMHALRHQNASVMLELGVPDKYAMERGGWSSEATLKRIYQHTMDDKRLAVNASISEYYESIAE